MLGLANTLKSALMANRPSRKPQLWEHLPLALRRRIELEIGSRTDQGWLDRPRVATLADLGPGGSHRPIRMELVVRDAINRAIYLFGQFEVSETRLLIALLRPGMTVLDVGANIGYYSLLAAVAVGPSGVVHAFEPNDAMFERARKNVELNGIDNVVFHRDAVSRETGEVRFYESELPENAGISSILAGTGRAATGKVVPAVSLDDFAARLGRPIDVLKMDIEGAEIQAIEGGTRLLGAASGPTIVFESFEVQPLVEALGALGYTVRSIDYTMADGLILRRLDDRAESIFAKYEAPNYIAVKDPALFDAVVERANGARSATLRLLGHL